MALTDLLPEALRPTKPIAVDGPTSPRVSGVSDTAITPVVEDVPGPVFAYRGQEQHGVPVTHGTEAPNDPRNAFLHTVDVENVHELHPPTPILVRDVTTKRRKRSRVITSSVNATSRLVLNRQETRTRVILSNWSAENIYIGFDNSTASALSGFPLSAWGSVELFTTEEIWGVSETGDACEVRILVEWEN